MSKFVFHAVVACGLALSVAGSAWAQDVNGAGASFPAPVYAKWASDYHAATQLRINYQSVGSSAGLRQIEARTVDFGASDAPLKDEALKDKGLVQFPTVIGGIVPVVNIKGVEPGQLRLTGPVLADIYLGKVRKWNDAAIQSLNPELKLPDEQIAVVRRADGSGTTFGFTNYLSQVSQAWKEQVGEGSAVKWPTGSGGKGNEGVAAFVSRLPSSIGYVEYAYAKQNKIAYAQLQNQDGQFVHPGEASFKAAAEGADWQNSFYQVLNNKPGAAAWPITTTTYILMHAKQDNAGKAAATLKFFDWVYQHGDAPAASLDYVALPSSVKDMVRKQWAEGIRDAAGQPIAWQ
ncbi:phosphate ABC transporter substrate-binding protein PstS [Vandammella animalimorsus]|uniref:Phosphate-binding protein PstS n=1 Tax=Vandammella animalimorsus TaxID=2029117 RepID=A0A2A2T3Y8_9BURK|nr:phosphate ABC transporter substrate-binding protein PstS [Vandammella animalimorsus]PAT31175.1 phosphate ABC transporter substrate-binding protein PstS [Vandammella animalimorsus]PAX16137.1 phosphate ABC transporter substrate-binding protein PstS [Vandammella animalimorsus]PAX18167.1 phosphate ABC transporter substrate-binding protein PstS [Vandammella animalimorsus]